MLLASFYPWNFQDLSSNLDLYSLLLLFYFFINFVIISHSFNHYLFWPFKYLGINFSILLKKYSFPSHAIFDFHNFFIFKPGSFSCHFILRFDIILLFIINSLLFQSCTNLGFFLHYLVVILYFLFHLTFFLNFNHILLIIH